MNTHRYTFKVFNGSSLSDYLGENNDRIQSQIDSKSDDYILEINKTGDISSLVENFIVDTIKVDFEGKRVSPPYEKLIPAEHFPPYRFNVTPGRSYPKQAVTYYLPYTGNGDLFRYTPNRHIIWTTEVFLEDQSLCFEVFSFNSKPEDIAKDINEQAEQIIKDVKTQLEHLVSEMENYNNQLSVFVKKLLQEREEKILEKNQIAELLETPIRE